MDISALPAPSHAGNMVLPVTVVREGHEVTMVVNRRTLLALTPDAEALEKAKDLSPDDVEVRNVLGLVQRTFVGAKKKNVPSFARYIAEGLESPEDLWLVPPITLFYHGKLRLVRLDETDASRVGIEIPLGEKLVPIDGGTQAAAWRHVQMKGDAPIIKVVLHYDRDIRWGRQGFSDLNTRAVRPNAAISIGMDSRDIASDFVTRLVGETGIDVDYTKRQLGVKDTALLTVSGLRSGIVTSVFGMAGLQYGSRPVSSYIPEGTDIEELADRVISGWTAVLNVIEEPLSRRTQTVVSTPVVLAALGGVVKALQDPAEIEKLLAPVSWERRIGDFFPWDQIAGKVTMRATGPGFAFASPKESGYVAFRALTEPNSAEGRRIRSTSLYEAQAA